MACYGCKKKDVSPALLQVKVTGLTAKTSLSIRVTDNTQNKVVLDISNQFGNNTYNSNSNVSPGDQLTIYCTANLNDNLDGDGDATLQYSFKGQSVGAHGGIIGRAGFTENETVPTP